jgi:HlyD family secretion protein
VDVRANLSANADIVLDRRAQVLALDESLLQFDEGKPYVEVETAPQKFEKRPIETGLSDGIVIEVVKGLTEKDRIKDLNAPRPEAASGA